MAAKPIFNKLRERLKGLKGAWSKVLAEFRKAARDFLKSIPIPERWRRSYLRCLSIVPLPEGGIKVTLDMSKGNKVDRFFAKAVEEGVPKGGIDMKKWYDRPVNIPINHAKGQIRSYQPTNGTIGSVQKVLASLGPGERAPSGLVKKLLPQQHVTDPLARAIRQNADFSRPSGKKDKAGSIMTFRRLSPVAPKNPDARKRWAKSWFWLRSGMKPYRLISKLQPILLAIAQKYVVMAILS
jgi:hypothetical protein